MSISFLDPQKMYLSIIGAQVEGFSDGTFVSISRNDQTFGSRGSLKGSHLVTKSKFSSYTLTFRLDNTAPSNTWIHSLYKLQETYGIVIPIPIIFKDMNGQASFMCPAAVIQEPNSTHGNKVETIEWTVLCPRAFNNVGGSGQTNAATQIIKTLTTLVSLAGMIGMDLSDIGTQAQQVLDKGVEFAGGFF